MKAQSKNKSREGRVATLDLKSRGQVATGE